MKVDLNRLAKKILNSAVRQYAIALIAGKRPNLRRIVDEAIKEQVAELLLNPEEEKVLRSKVRV